MSSYPHDIRRTDSAFHLRQVLQNLEAAIASIIVLAYFWKSAGIRPFKYVDAI